MQTRKNFFARIEQHDDDDAYTRAPIHFGLILVCKELLFLFTSHGSQMHFEDLEVFDCLVLMDTKIVGNQS